jgi:hypothetical protein
VREELFITVWKPLKSSAIAVESASKRGEKKFLPRVENLSSPSSLALHCDAQLIACKPLRDSVRIVNAV